MSRWLEGKTIVVGLSGGIACYKAADVVRQLRSAGGARARGDDAHARGVHHAADACRRSPASRCRPTSSI